MGLFDSMRVPFPGWSIVREIGHGGYGTVYEIRRHLLDVDERSAMKVIPVPRDPAEIQDYLNDGYDFDNLEKRYAGSRNAVLREYTMMARMKDSANIVRCEDITVVMNPDRISSRIFIRMELLTPMREYEKLRTYDENEVIRLGLNMCSILSVCEREGVVHRDIKPANIMVSAGGVYKLGDFGIARMMDHTTTGTRIGTINYMAPEVYSGGKYGHTADIYSLGLVLYWLMNNRRIPFLSAENRGSNIEEELEAQQKRLRGFPVPRPCFGSARLAEVVRKALAFYPADRFQTAQEFGRALRACLKNSGETTFVQGDGTLFGGGRTEGYGGERADSDGRYGSGLRTDPVGRAGMSGTAATGLYRQDPGEKTYRYGESKQESESGQGRLTKDQSAAGHEIRQEYRGGIPPVVGNGLQEKAGEDQGPRTGTAQQKRTSTIREIFPFVVGIAVILAAAALIFYLSHREDDPPGGSGTSSGAYGETSSASASTETAAPTIVTGTPKAETTPKQETTPKAEEPTAAEPAPVTVQTQYGVMEYGSELFPVKNEVNIRREPTHYSDLVFTFDPAPHGNSSELIFKGKVAEGYGSDNVLHTWYFVGAVSDSKHDGWARSDLVRLPAYDNGPWHIYIDGSESSRKICVLHDPQGGLNVRSEPKHESELVDTVYGGTKLYYYDETGQGYGSDGLLHEWYRVEWAVPGSSEEKAGWVRSDLVTVQYE